ncbi:MAG: hypothetical protein BWX80_01564 [Candidatus Hydrogenedentes bacterium ADurb.Bin101]|nr:MAG: hypothetical protein BWX80_01564 [Candidatus Hydrogenedentes bacterium ADurb.Bin101]
MRQIAGFYNNRTIPPVLKTLLIGIIANEKGIGTDYRGKSEIRILFMCIRVV